MESATVESPRPSPLAAQKPSVVSCAWLECVGWESLDCTGGFYSTQRWRGIGIGRLLDSVTLHLDARYVSFISVTSYRWSLPLEEARSALLATHIAEEPLSHEHGFPLHLVAPGRRGFAWVKWITRIEVLTEPDPVQVVSIFTSSFTDAGRGE
jgi:DMSO/TMAO reductase YedYZ molybdopterin-dependent catalytic subunit